jgi:hypothetical protein
MLDVGFAGIIIDHPDAAEGCQLSFFSAVESGFCRYKPTAL